MAWALPLLPLLLAMETVSLSPYLHLEPVFGKEYKNKQVHFHPRMYGKKHKISDPFRSYLHFTKNSELLGSTVIWNESFVRESPSTTAQGMLSVNNCLGHSARGDKISEYSSLVSN